MFRIISLRALTFLGAFLLFQIELIIAKILLPNYGGSYMVWGACMVFFQAALLGGYAFSHWTLAKFGIRKCRNGFLLFACLPFLFFPGRELVVGSPSSILPLTVDIFGQLLLTIGPVFFVLSTISLLTQVWLSSSLLVEKDDPYALYGWSNLGSFAALLSYPFFFEFYFDLDQQLLIWRMLYGGLLAMIVLSLILIPVSAREKMRHSSQDLWKVHPVWLWIAMSAAGAMMFMAVTNMIGIEIGQMPLLWILPLSIYLLSFVLNFKKEPWCPGWIRDGIDWIIGFGMILFLAIQHLTVVILAEVLLLLVFLFLFVMYCQNTLIENKPKDQGSLTFFYLMISAGGFVGGLLTSWVIPLVFPFLAEYLIALILIALVVERQRIVAVRAGGLWFVFVFFAVLFLWPVVFVASPGWGHIFLMLFTFYAIKVLRQQKHAITLVLLLVVVLYPYLEIVWENKVFAFKKRNYYGITKVIHNKEMSLLYHGTILHGMQLKPVELSLEPTTYFGKNSPVGQLLLSQVVRNQSVGVVGLGVGTLAAYSQPGMTMDFYEIDGDILKIAKEHFTFLRNAVGEVRHVIGDARVTLPTQADVRYDLLIIDAFSGDAVPPHLLTREAIRQYRQKIAPAGIILMHITNRYVKLDIVAGRVAMSEGARFAYLQTGEHEPWEVGSYWIAMTWDEEQFQKIKDGLGWRVLPIDSRVIPWTDRYTNLVRMLKWKEFLYAK